MGTAGQSITLANSIIGVGILAMPFCFQQCGVLLATLILLFMGLISRLCCYFLLKSALLARRRNFEFLAFHVFGPAGKLAVEIGIIGFLMGTCIAYFVVVGDLGPQIIAKLFNINQSDILRTSIMVLVSLLCVLPLGLLRNVDSLSNVSAATIGFYFCLVMKVIAEAASQLLTGEWQVHMELWKPAGVLQCVPIFSMALFCQTQLFEIFESLPTLSLEKMNLVTKNAINICTAVYFTLGVFGYIAFCSQQISGNILMSLSPTMASDVIKLGFVMSVAFSFPLIIFPCRASLYSLLYKKVHHSHHDHIINHSIPETSFRCITVAIIAVTLFISLLIPNIELVLGLVGSTIGVMVCIVFPAACFINVTFKNTNERVLAKGVLVLGLIIMVLGTYANLQAAESQIDKYDERYITPEKIDKLVEEFFEKMDKSEDGILVKPIDKNDVKVDEDVVKDSMALPPNPVPPESNEKPVKKDEIKKENYNVLDEPIKDKVSETHPKNLKKINDIKLNNGDSNKISNENSDKISNRENKIDNVDSDKITNKQIDEKQVSEDKKQIEKKQQQLIETIKQHGEEQKELLKEQKVILDEILKTKKEMALKTEAEKSIEAKKIAVESIKKIADMAIQSLAGVSEKPAEEKKEDIGKLADEAVQEIAKKAVETIEAIKEINEKTEVKPEEKSAPVPNPAPIPSQNILQPAQNVQQIQNIPQNIPPPASSAIHPVPDNPEYNIQQLLQSVQKLQLPVQNGQTPDQNVLTPEQNVPQPSLNAQQPDQNIHQQGQNLPLPLENAQQSAQNVQLPQNVQQVAQSSLQSIQKVEQSADIQQPVSQGDQKIPDPIPNIQLLAENIQQPVINIQQQSQFQQPEHKEQNPVQNVQQVPKVQQNILPNVAQFVSNNLSNQQGQIENSQAQNDQIPLKKHSHSQDEPKSYQVGEDAQKPEGSNVNNIQPQNQIEISKAAASKLNDKVENDANDKVKSVPRQKREVVDCTEKSALKPEDKEICERLVNVPQYQGSDKIDLPKIDLSDVGLLRSLPLDTNVIYIGRSLKSYDDNENR